MRTAISHTGLVMRVQRVTLSRTVSVLSALIVLALIVSTLSVCFGSSHISLSLFFDTGEEGRVAQDVLWNLRLPRAAAAFAVGGLLGVAGALMQVLLRNPLAEPYVLGTSGGASVGAMLVMLLAGSSGWVSIGACIGSLTAIAVVFTLARGDGSWTQARLLLTGVAVAAFCSAMTSLLLSLAPDGILRGMVFWLLGDLSGADWRQASVVLLLAIAGLMPFARDLNVFALGPQQAYGLGVNVPLIRGVIYVTIAITASVAVTTAGLIGFVGLLVPHSLRLIVGNDQRLLLPATALGGGILLTFADLVSRTLIAPQQLPVGVVTAVFGAPFFLILLNRRAR